MWEVVICIHVWGALKANVGSKMSTEGRSATYRGLRGVLLRGIDFHSGPLQNYARWELGARAPERDGHQGVRES